MGSKQLTKFCTCRMVSVEAKLLEARTSLVEEVDLESREGWDKEESSFLGHRRLPL